MRAITVALISTLAVGACAQKSDRSEATAATRSAAAPAPAAGSAAATDQKAEQSSLEPGRPADHRKVVRTGRIELVVAGYDDARGKLEAMINAAGGYVDSTQVDRRQGAISAATLVVRIPSDAFASMLPKLAQLGEITSETTSAADITDQFVDTEARLASARQLEKRMLELATERNGTIDQVLAGERELARVRGEIEGYQGHLRQWGDQVALSTLTIELTTRGAEIAVAPPPTLGSRTSSAFHGSVDALSGFGSWLAVTGIALLPWLIVLVPVGFLLRWLARRLYRSLPTAIAKPPNT